MHSKNAGNWPTWTTSQVRAQPHRRLPKITLGFPWPEVTPLDASPCRIRKSARVGMVKNKQPGEVSVSPARIAGFRRHEPGTQPDSFHPDYRATRLRAPSQPLIVLPHSL